MIPARVVNIPVLSDPGLVSRGKSGGPGSVESAPLVQPENLAGALRGTPLDQTHGRQHAAHPHDLAIQVDCLEPDEFTLGRHQALDVKRFAVDLAPCGAYGGGVLVTIRRGEVDVAHWPIQTVVTHVSIPANPLALA